MLVRPYPVLFYQENSTMHSLVFLMFWSKGDAGFLKITNFRYLP